MVTTSSDPAPFDPLRVNGYVQAGEFLNLEDDLEGMDDAIAALGNAEQHLANLRHAYEALAQRFTVLRDGHNRLMQASTVVGDPCPLCGVPLDPDGNCS